MLENDKNKLRLTTLQKENDLDEVYGYQEPSEPGKYTGWLVNMHTGDTLRIVSDDIIKKAISSQKHKVGCVFPMVILYEFRMR